MSDAATENDKAQGFGLTEPMQLLSADDVRRIVRGEIEAQARERAEMTIGSVREHPIALPSYVIDMLQKASAETKRWDDAIHAMGPHPFWALPSRDLTLGRRLRRTLHALTPRRLRKLSSLQKLLLGERTDYRPTPRARPANASRVA